MTEDFLEFHGGFGAMVCGQLGLATHTDGMQGPEETKIAAGAARR
jgi:hypothetical protein